MLAARRGEADPGGGSPEAAALPLPLTRGAGAGEVVAAPLEEPRREAASFSEGGSAGASGTSAGPTAPTNWVARLQYHLAGRRARREGYMTGRQA